ncbi:MAG: hypothetical protein ACLR5X_09950 [Oscillospiraceae bacterium]
MRDPLFLAQKSTDATEADQQVIIDLLDTLWANLDHCVGMAANGDWCKEKYHCGGSGPISICYGKSSYYKEDRAFIIKVSTTGMLVP